MEGAGGEFFAGFFGLGGGDLFDAVGADFGAVAGHFGQAGFDQLPDITVGGGDIEHGAGGFGGVAGEERFGDEDHFHAGGGLDEFGLHGLDVDLPDQDLHGGEDAEFGVGIGVGRGGDEAVGGEVFGELRAAGKGFAELLFDCGAEVAGGVALCTDAHGADEAQAGVGSQGAAEHNQLALAIVDAPKHHRTGEADVAGGHQLHGLAIEQ